MNATPQRFHGWKEIATHFNRSVRCVQRWERQEKLPVHRHIHARGDTVYAFLEELIAWQHVERAAASKSVALAEKEKVLKMQNASIGRKIRRPHCQVLNERLSERHVAWSAADLQNIAYQLALFFLRAAEDNRPNISADARFNAINATSRTQNRSV
jgi:hypothetical protein